MGMVFYVSHSHVVVDHNVLHYPVVDFALGGLPHHYYLHPKEVCPYNYYLSSCKEKAALAK